MAFAGGRGDAPSEKEVPVVHDYHRAYLPQRTRLGAARDESSHGDSPGSRAKRVMTAGSDEWDDDSYRTSLPVRSPQESRKEPSRQEEVDESTLVSRSPSRRRAPPSHEHRRREPKHSVAAEEPAPVEKPSKSRVTFTPEGEEDRLCREISEGKEVDWVHAVSSGKASVGVLLQAAARAANLEVLDSLLEEATEANIETLKRIHDLPVEVTERLDA